MILTSQDFEEIPWKHIWNWKGPYRIAVFIWLATHNKLMTTLRRSKWAGSNADCHLCLGFPEMDVHIIRDCSRALHPVRKIQQLKLSTGCFLLQVGSSSTQMELLKAIQVMLDVAVYSEDAMVSGYQDSAIT